MIGRKGWGQGKELFFQSERVQKARGVARGGVVGNQKGRGKILEKDYEQKKELKGKQETSSSGKCKEGFVEEDRAVLRDGDH